MRVAVVDIGTNSTRLLVADVAGGAIAELDRRSTVTRLGQGLEATGSLGEEPQARVFRALDDYAAAIADHGSGVRVGVMTSAVRDAANGAAFADAVRERYSLDASTLSGDEEARLTFLGATAARSPDERDGIVVIDIGGGSTELVTREFHVSTQVGVVRHTERHIASDPPSPAEIAALARDARGVFESSVPQAVTDRVSGAVAVAGTATSTAAIHLALEPYDTSRVEGQRLSVSDLEDQLARLAALPLDERRLVPGLHPDRAPTIVAGVAILLEALGAFGLSAVEVSDRDILWGVALDAASQPR